MCHNEDKLIHNEIFVLPKNLIQGSRKKSAPINLFRIYSPEHFDTKFVLGYSILHKKRKSPVKVLVNIFLEIRFLLIKEVLKIISKTAFWFIKNYISHNRLFDKHEYS